MLIIYNSELICIYCLQSYFVLLWNSIFNLQIIVVGMETLK